jgi:hypothetical protein
MVIIGTMSFPPEQSNEIGKRFLKLSPLPAYMTMKGPFVSNEVGAGIKVMTVYEFDQSKTREATDTVFNRYSTFYGVSGFTCSVNIWLETSEALKMIGLA